jgi:hypothetical protein
MDITAFFTLLCCVMFGEIQPVLFLVRRKEPEPLAQGADMVKGRENCRSDKPGFVGNLSQPCREGRLHLEGDDLVFLFLRILHEHLLWRESNTK